MQARLYEFLKGNTASLLICEDDKEADLLYNVSEFLGFKSFVLPDFRAYENDDLRPFLKELFELCKVLYEYHKCSEKKILISPIKTILNKLPDKKHLSSFIIDKNKPLDIQRLKEELLLMAYEGVDMVQERAEFSIRADVVDIFSLNDENPLRILFFENEVESIRYFDVNTQKSFPHELDKVELCPFLAHFTKDSYELLQDKIKNLSENALQGDNASLAFWCVDDFKDYLELDFYCIKTFNQDEFSKDISKINSKLIPQARHYKDLDSRYSKDFFLFHKDKDVKLLARNEALFAELDLKELNNIKYIKSPFRVNIIGDKELIASLNKKEKSKRLTRSSLIVDELKKGDFIVHQNYGIGKFIGLENIAVAGVKKDFVSLLYQNDDKLLLPVENLYLIDKYISSSSSIPNLDRLGKGTFLKLKERLRAKLFAIASQIVSMAAKRALIKAKPIKINQEELLLFENSANFTYTKDQSEVCKDIRADFMSSNVMDRLLSGDVGFGKTEVALNASFCVIKSGFSVFFFVPTTLLSHQHYKTAKKRLSPFGIEVFKLDRFTKTKDKNFILNKLAKKEPCLVIGTHSLLSVSCDNLALIIIDEEHKFGVKQKEKLKEFSQNSHILSMSATPIPRSLNQALSSIKSYSILQSPPNDRLDVRTFVKEYDEALLKEAISRELRRAGQIFYIHNHIASINECKKRLLELFPKLRILILHSKVDSKTTEEEMIKFEEKEYDLLLCTSIVESGIDLANANTMIVENSDRFGMADLHQLRGRVGRSSKQGYCYFLIEDKKDLKAEAIKRLTSLQSNSFLGAGSILAYHDLEIRGGGNLLGVDQSGHIEQIGYSLYLKMLEDEINILSKGKDLDALDTELKLSVNAFLSEELIREDRLRLELYRRLSKCKALDEVYDIAGEIEDRFGKLDRYTRNFLDLIKIKILANKNFKVISSYEANIHFLKRDDSKELVKSASGADEDIIACILQRLRKEQDGLAKI